MKPAKNTNNTTNATNTTNPNNTNIVTMFDGDFALDNLKDPFGNDIFTPTGDSADYTVIDVWAQSELTTASIYFVILNNDADIYQLVTMESGAGANPSVQGSR